MNKLKLDLDTVEVESFETSLPAQFARGTIRANDNSSVCPVDGTDACTIFCNGNSIGCAMSWATACTCDPESNGQCSYACPNPTTMVAW